MQAYQGRDIAIESKHIAYDIRAHAAFSGKLISKTLLRAGALKGYPERKGVTDRGVFLLLYQISYTTSEGL